ncbi:MAG: Holliday junction resolvase RuvX [Candidatus Doudnabacteria bacterium]
MRVLAIDWGEARVGAAVSDEEGKIAFPLEQFFETQNAIAEIIKIINELGISLVLVGLPKNLAGKEEKSAVKLKVFVDNLSKAVKVPITLIDERFTSVEATNRLRELGIKEKEQRGVKDNIAAQIMLQQYLDTKKARTAE